MSSLIAGLSKMVTAGTPTKSSKRSDSHLETAFSGVLNSDQTPNSVEDGFSEEFTCQSLPVERVVVRRPQATATTVRNRLRIAKGTQTRQSEVKVGPDMTQVPSEKHREYIYRTLKDEVISEYNTKIRFYHFDNAMLNDFSPERKEHYKMALAKRQKWYNEAKKQAK
ncbi:unnamed protein product [Bursaphelenchus okinawaensis]|uniref:Uncharacterized protein n=1 Tax=Bursaphelenchus okinawaensis TaxID=465554 RepID=A0A811JW39_9BILA|nr:unnamed protein product [Bursaphelenchus okinawaensis]CAG9085655.1 unnamed protein product [Bursaphelenchus okinawaensis]